MTRPRFFTVLLGALALVAGALFWLQRQATEALRTEIVLLREQKAELAKARTENARLKAAQISEAEAARLRADRAALLRMRGEIERTRKDVERQEKVLKELEADAVVTVRLTLSLKAGEDVVIDGEPFNELRLRQKLASLPKGSRFDLKLISTGSITPRDLEKMQKTLGEIRDVARSLGLGFKLETIDPPSAL